MPDFFNFGARHLPADPQLYAMTSFCSVAKTQLSQLVTRIQEFAGMYTAQLVNGYAVTQHENRRQTTGTTEH